MMYQGNLLVVDDTIENLKVLASILSQEGYKVRSAINGETALLAVEAALPDLILLDINMPLMDGYEVCERLKSDPATRDIPIIFISAYSDIQDKVKGFHVGGVDYITKPFQMEEVLARIYAQMQLLRQRREIEALRQAELHHLEKLRISEARYHDLFENAHELIQSVGSDGRFLYVNRYWSQKLGYSSEEAESLHFTQIIHPSHIEHCQELFRQVQLRIDGIDNIDLIFVTRDGDEIYAEGNINAQQSVNSEFHTRGIFRDVTEKRRLEQQAFELVLERERIQSLENFIGITTHDLRTPLTALMMGLHLLKRTTDPQRQLKRIEQIEEQASHLQYLIEELYTMFQLDRDESSTTAPITIEPLLQSFRTRLSQLHQTKDIKIHWNLAPNLPIIQGDEIQLHLAFNHLIENALLYTPSGGSVNILAYQDSDTLVVAVEDNGIGISEADLPHIFERFYKANAARTSNGSGVGLGLTMVERIVQTHGGSIAVISNEGEGSRFEVQLPLLHSVRVSTAKLRS